MEIFEYRGVEGLVYAEVTKDDDTGYTAGPVKALAGVAEIGRTTETSNETHYYDNTPAVLISSTGADELTCTVSGIPLDILAELTGQQFDTATGTLIEGERTPKYFAIGYKAKKTNGKEVYVWRYKGMFNIPDNSFKTEDDGTDASGQEITYTGISTTHRFNGKRVKAINVDLEQDKADITGFFDSVVTPDNLTAKA